MSHIALILVGMLAAYGTLAGVVLFVGERLSGVGDRQDLTARLRRLHALAFFAFLVGAGLAWMAYASDHPSKQKHLLLPIIFVAIVYAYPVVVALKAALVSALLQLVRTLFRR